MHVVAAASPQPVTWQFSGPGGTAAAAGGELALAACPADGVDDPGGTDGVGKRCLPWALWRRKTQDFQIKSMLNLILTTQFNLFNCLSRYNHRESILLPFYHLVCMLSIFYLFGTGVAALSWGDVSYVEIWLCGKSWGVVFAFTKRVIKYSSIISCKMTGIYVHTYNRATLEYSWEMRL